MRQVRQQGMALVAGLVVLVVITVVGIAAVNRGAMQQEAAYVQDQMSMAFEAAEASIEAVIQEQESPALSDLDRALAQARQLPALDLSGSGLSCFGGPGIERQLNEKGLLSGKIHVQGWQLSTQPPVLSWSRTAFLGEDPFLVQGGEAETVDSEIALHAFMVRGCGRVGIVQDDKVTGSPVAQANTLTMSVLGPRE